VAGPVLDPLCFPAILIPTGQEASLCSFGPNRYEAGQATLSCTGILQTPLTSSEVSLLIGSRYEIRSVEFYLHSHIVGTYTDQPIRVPMRNWPVAKAERDRRSTFYSPGIGRFRTLFISSRPRRGRTRQQWLPFAQLNLSVEASFRQGAPDNSLSKRYSFSGSRSEAHREWTSPEPKRPDQRRVTRRTDDVTDTPPTLRVQVAGNLYCWSKLKAIDTGSPSEFTKRVPNCDAESLATARTNQCPTVSKARVVRP
jgi:hypothetical protein